jgi:hypothetical protein
VEIDWTWQAIVGETFAALRGWVRISGLVLLVIVYQIQRGLGAWGLKGSRKEVADTQVLESYARSS